MLSPNDKKLEKLDPFYRPSISKQKTSVEIINEARNALRTVRTQRPFTPQEDQRKLFGPASSRTPENRPPSSFRLPEYLHSPFPPQPSSPLPWSLSSKKTVESKEMVMMGDSMMKINGICLTESNAVGHTKSHPLQLTYDGGFREIKEQEMFIGTALSHLRSGGDQGKRRARASSCPTSSDLSRPQTKTVSKADLEKKDTEAEADEVFWTTRILPILYEIEKEENIETVCAACTKLHHALEEGNMLGNKFKRRRVLLKTLYKLVDVGSDLLNLKLAKIILALRERRKNLLNVCKLIFKKNEKNDSLIQNDNILESLLEVLRSEDLQTNTEAFLYCMGTIKFISGNPGFLNEMMNKGAVEVLVNLIKEINENTKECGTCLPNLGHLLVQVTATLRNLADSPLARRKLLGTSSLPQLCTVMEQFSGDKDICTNIARIFSKLTSYSDCCAAVANYSRCYALFLNLINKYQRKQDLIVRIVFILGNLTAKNNQAREQFSKEKGGVPSLVSLFQTFHELDLHSQKPMGEGAVQKAPSEVEDVLVKLTRVLANLAIHPGIGQTLATNQQVVGLLLTTLERKSLGECEELVINTTATINNLSYYQVKNSVILDKKLYIAQLLLKLLVSNNMDGILEAVRVFGNLSQDHDICNFIVQNNVHKFMLALLDAKHQDICFSACGVLLNLTVDKDKRAILKEGGGITKLVDCLRDFGPTDWQLACLVCKTLWNFSENITNAASCFGDEDTDTLLVLLSSFLGKTLDYVGYKEPDGRAQWHDDCPPPVEAGCGTDKEASERMYPKAMK
ncbi:Armadillo repeat-containing protein 2 [Tupaia chinensis]|uniref:Armadillo repeat-containing protein 2 n=1 Tax=Tupaia chinensis TaxID=246437 RepID=L9JHT6_TUPCH|nr:Armadillo repeat-containing protein 2 [Tupaia chinensis]